MKQQAPLKRRDQRTKSMSKLTLALTLALLVLAGCNTVEGVGEAYIAQMAAYRAVLTQRWPNRPIRCLLVWTDGPRLMEIPPFALDRAFKAINP